MKKLAVLFPGVNYSVDCPLLYYIGSLCENVGYDICKVQYEGLGKKPENQLPMPGEQPQKRKPESQSLERKREWSLDDCIEAEYTALKQKLSKVMLQGYGEVLFVSKSMGTVLAAHLEEEYALENVSHVMLTPIDQTLPYLQKGAQNGIHRRILFMISGTSDTKVNHEALRKICREHGYPLTETEGVGHRLEVHEDVIKSIEILESILKAVQGKL